MPLWQEAGVAAGALLVVALLARLVHRWWPRRAVAIVAAAGQEAATILGLFTLWQVVRILGVRRVEGGIERADWIWRAEQWAHLPSEAAMEHVMLGHEAWLRAANVFYAWVHFPAMNVFLVWLFARHRDAYPPVRTTIVLLTGSSLLFHMFLPVAPPRMLTSAGFVDEAEMLGQSVYGEFGDGVAAQLSAMPSVHVGWAFLIAYEVIRISPSRWRWLIVIHPIVTTIVVVVTANHFWADGILAVILLVLAVLGSAGLAHLGRRLRDRRGAAAAHNAPPDLPSAGLPAPSSRLAPSCTSALPSPPRLSSRRPTRPSPGPTP
jgi:hypothetical protein